MNLIKLYIPIEKESIFKTCFESSEEMQKYSIKEVHPCVFGFPTRLYKYQLYIFELQSESKPLIDFYLNFVADTYQPEDKYFYEVNDTTMEVTIHKEY